MNKKIIISAIIATSVLSAGNASAMYEMSGKEMRENHKMEKHEMRENFKKETTERKMGNMEDRKKMHDEKMAEKKAKMMKMQEIMKPYFEALPKETRDKLNELKSEKKAIMAEKMKKHEEMFEKMKTMTPSELKKHRAEMKEKRKKEKEEHKKAAQSHFAKVKEIVGDKTPEAKAFIAKCEQMHKKSKEEKQEMRKEHKEEKQEMRKEHRIKREEMRKEHKEKRFELRMKYKKAFATRLKGKLEKISNTKLEKISKMIDSRIAKFEANTKLSEEKKNRLVAIYSALKELIDEKLDQDSGEEILDELLK